MSDAFEREFIALLKVCKNVVDYKNVFNPFDLSKSSENPIAKYLNRYTKAFYKAGSSHFKDEILVIYQKYRMRIMNSSTIDAWLSETSVDLQFGEGQSKVDKSYRLMLSAIYKNAKMIAREAGSKVIDDSDASPPEIDYPDKILLHLYRVFRDVEPSKNDRDQLTKWINEIEVSIGERDADSNDGPSLGGMMNIGNMGNIMGMASSLMSQMGVSLPKMADGKSMPSGDDLGKMLGSVIKDNDLQNTLMNITKDLEGCKSIETAFSKIGQNLKNSKIFETLKELSPPETEEEIPEVVPIVEDE